MPTSTRRRVDHPRRGGAREHDMPIPPGALVRWPVRSGRRPRRRPACGGAGPRRQHAGAHRPARRHRARAQDRRRDLDRADQQAPRLSRPAGRVDPPRRSVEAGRDAHALRATDHRGQGGSDHGALRDGRDPVGHGRGPALQQAADPPLVRDPQAGDLRDAVPREPAEPRAGQGRAQQGHRRAGIDREAAEDDRGGDEQVPVGALHLAGSARGRGGAGPQGRAVPRVRVRQP